VLGVECTKDIAFNLRVEKLEKKMNISFKIPITVVSERIQGAVPRQWSCLTIKAAILWSSHNEILGATNHKC